MIYDLLAPFYDAVNSELDYSAWADFIEKIVKKEYNGRPELVLDLGCGTGKMTLELARRGYDMTGVDCSPEMLNIARENSDREGLDVLWLCQDMTEFELYGTVDVCVCCLDTLNHLTEPSELEKCLSLVHNYVVPNGLFIFDINGKFKFENIYSDRSYVMEEEGGVCIWQNDYDEETRLCDFYITLFKERENALYERYDDMQTERMYTVKEMKNSLEKCGFQTLGVYSNFDFNEGTDECQRIYFVAKIIK